MDKVRGVQTDLETRTDCGLKRPSLWAPPVISAV
jgi:hypothetical protein